MAKRKQARAVWGETTFQPEDSATEREYTLFVRCNDYISASVRVACATSATDACAKAQWLFKLPIRWDIPEGGEGECADPLEIFWTRKMESLPEIYEAPSKWIRRWRKTYTQDQIMAAIEITAGRLSRSPLASNSRDAAASYTAGVLRNITGEVPERITGEMANGGPDTF